MSGINANSVPADMKKPAKILYIVLFLVLIIIPVPLFLSVRGYVDTENYEERTLYPFPYTQEAAEYYGSATTADTFPQQFENWFNDHLPFRNQLLTFNGLFDYRVLQTSSSESVVVGKEGWLFYKGSQVAGEDPIGDYRGTNAFTDEELQQIADHLTQARDILAAQGKDFVLYIAPNKERVYSELMPDSFGEPNAHCRMNQLISYLRDNTDLKVVCSYDTLMSWKETHPERPIYFQYDTHWNGFGAYVGAEPLVEALGYDFTPADEVEITDRGTGSYDLARLIHLGNILTDGPNYVVSGYTPHPLTSSSSDDGYVFHYSTTDGQAPGGRIFVIGDSFSTLLMPYIACHYWSGTMMFYYAYNYAALQEEDPDVVVYETVERYIGNLLDFTLEGGYTGETK